MELGKKGCGKSANSLCGKELYQSGDKFPMMFKKRDTVALACS